jgi:predicted nuclease with TOPRIM domain
MESLRTDLALARDEITRLRTDNTKLRLNAQRLLGRQLNQIDQGELLARVDALATENHRLTEKLRQCAKEKSVLGDRITELEEDIAAARTAMRRMIKEQSSGV